MHLFLSVVLTALTVHAATFDWDCTNALGACQNYCFYAQCRGGAGQQYTFDANTANRPPRRQASGCRRNPCNDAGLSYSSFGNSCDEFPFASTQEGGSGARLRCVDSSENSSTLLSSICLPTLQKCSLSLLIREQAREANLPISTELLPTALSLASRLRIGRGRTFSLLRL